MRKACTRRVLAGREPCCAVFGAKETKNFAWGCGYFGHESRESSPLKKTLRRHYSNAPSFTVHHVNQKTKTAPFDPTVFDLESSHPSHLTDAHHTTDTINGHRHDYNLAEHSHEVEVPKESFFRRELPKVCISFSSDEGKKLFKEALRK